MLNLLDGIEVITKVLVDYNKVIDDVKNNCELLNKINVKNEFLLVALCNGWVISDMGVM